MYIPDIELHEPATLEEAAAALTRHAPDARLLAGGTDLLVDLKTGRASFHHLVSISRIDGLQNISETRNGLRIGALTTAAQITASPIIRERYAPLLDATTKMAAQQIRNVATIGGNIAAAVPCADLPPILTAMNASVTLRSSNGKRDVPLDAFFVGPRQTVLRTDEVLTAVYIPQPPPGSGAAYARFQLRDGNTIAVAAVAAGILLGNDGVVKDARIVLGAVAPIPKFVPAAGTALTGHRLDDDVINRAATIAMMAAEPICDVRGWAEFRRDIVGVMARRAIETARDRIAGARKEAH